MTPGQAYIHWYVDVEHHQSRCAHTALPNRYYIILHEIAHNKTPFHDENHELLVAGLSARFLPRLHSVEEVREYFNCTADV